MSKMEKLQKEGLEAFRDGNYELAQSKFEALLEIAEAEGQPVKAAEALNDLGVTRKQLGDLDGAMEALRQALKYYQDNDDELGEAKTLGNFGMVEEAAEKYEDSIQSYLDAASIFEELGETELATFTWQALSKLQLRQKDWLNAIASYERGLDNLPDNSVKKKFVKNLLKAPGKFM